MPQDLKILPQAAPPETGGSSTLPPKQLEGVPLSMALKERGCLWWFPLGQHGRTFPQEMDRGLQEPDGSPLHSAALPRNRPHTSCQRWPHQPHCAPASVETQVARLNTCAPARTLSGHGERSPEPARPGEGGQCAAPCGTEGRTWGPVNGHSSRRSPGKRR